MTNFNAYSKNTVRTATRASAAPRREEVLAELRQIESAQKITGVRSIK